MQKTFIFLFISFFSLMLLTGQSSVKAQSAFKPFGNLFTPPKSYVVRHVDKGPVIDGDINDTAWLQAAWTDDFTDIEGNLKPAPAYKTRVKMLWDDSCLYIAAKIDDPNVWATLKQHDAVIFNDNDFEVFLNPNNSTHQYFEIEYNALNTVFDLFLNKPYRNNGSAMINWNAEGLRSAVKILGTLNNPDDKDEGWTIEMAIPFKAVSLGNNVQVPGEGSIWRINFSRVEWDTQVVNGSYLKLKDGSRHNLPEHNWVWSAQGVVNMHYPERWAYLQFIKGITTDTKFILPYAEKQKRYLWLVYYRQKQWHNAHKSYAGSLKAFGLKKAVKIDNEINLLQMEATHHQFMAFITNTRDNEIWSINQDGLIRKLNSATDE